MKVCKYVFSIIGAILVIGAIVAVIIVFRDVIQEFFNNTKCKVIKLKNNIIENKDYADFADV